MLAPNAKLRSLVVPQEVPQAPEPAAPATPPAECEATCAHHRPVRLSQAAQRVFELERAAAALAGDGAYAVAEWLLQRALARAGVPAGPWRERRAAAMVDRLARHPLQRQAFELRSA